MAALGDFEEILSEPNKDCTACVATRLRRVPARNLGGPLALGDPGAGTIHGQEAQDISDLAGLLRSRDRGA